MSPRPGEVWLADLGMVAKTRPVVVVSRFDADPPRALVLYVPMTTQDRGSDYEVGIPNYHFCIHRAWRTCRASRRCRWRVSNAGSAWCRKKS